MVRVLMALEAVAEVPVSATVHSSSSLAEGRKLLVVGNQEVYRIHLSIESIAHRLPQLLRRHSIPTIDAVVDRCVAV